MEQYRLHFDGEIAKLEEANRWKTIADTIFQQWARCPNDLKHLLCTGTQLWYTLLIMEYIQNDPFPPDNIEYVSCVELQSKLMDVTRYGFKYFHDNPVFNAYFGYMISVMPYFFLDYQGDYSGWKAKGIEMICRSYRLDPDSPFTKAMYYEAESNTNNIPFCQACKELWTTMTAEQWGNSAVQQYFFRILYGEVFCTEDG